MVLRDLITPINKMSLSQFEAQLKLPSKLPSTWKPPEVEKKVGAKKKPTGGRKVKSNSDKQIDNLLSGLTPAELKAVSELMKEVK